MLYHLGIGSNLGDREANLFRCHTLLQEEKTVVISFSALYETEPVGIKEQPWFLNQALAIDSQRLPLELLEEIQSIERRMGRIPTEIGGPRLVDIDILLAGDEVIVHDRLKIPHPRLTERNFVLIPLAEIAPTAIHPLQKRTIQQLKESCSDTSEVRRYFKRGSNSDD